MKKQNSFMVVAAVCGALLAGPAFAQGAPAGGTMGNMPMKSAPKHKAAKKPTHMASRSKHKMTCYDYAWESQDQKDCLAKGSGSKNM
jgi:hypothetical protein